MIRSRLFAVTACGLMLALAACAPGAPHPATIATKPVKRGAVDQAVALLQDGKEKDAARALARILKKNPNDGAALLLRNAIEKDPAALLPGESYPYVVRPGDTMMTIAERYLGSSLKFYALARYNHIAVPSALATGQLLRVPSPLLKPRPMVEPVPEKPAEAARPETSKPKAKKAAGAAAGAPAAAPPVVPSANPALAARMRGAGLAALAQGNVNRAVALLGRAAALDPGNPLIQRDLARAQRIQSTVQAKH